MKNRLIGAAGILLAMMATSASAAESKPVSSQQCSAYVGQQVAPMAFDDVAKNYSSIPPKDEFETTDQYKQRVESSIPNGQNPQILAKKVEDLKYFPYDADQQILSVQAYAFDNTNFDAWSAFYYAKTKDLSANTGSNNIDVVISETDKESGTYIGQNSFGAKVRITKTTRTTKALFQRKASFGENLFRNTGKNGVIGSFSLSPEEARRLRSNLHIAFVIQPKLPFVVKSTYPFGEPTVSNPEEIKVDATVLVADIQCGLLLDGTGTVLGAYDAQGMK